MIENNNNSIENKQMLDESDQDVYKNTGGGNFGNDLPTDYSSTVNNSQKDIDSSVLGFRESFNTVDKEDEVKKEGVKMVGRIKISEFHNEDE